MCVIFTLENTCIDLPLMDDVPFCGQDCVIISPARVVGKTSHQTGSFSAGQVTGGTSVYKYVCVIIT